MKNNEHKFAKRCADKAARQLAEFPVGKTILEVEGYLQPTTATTYWWTKERLYWAEYRKLK